MMRALLVIWAMLCVHAFADSQCAPDRAKQDECGPASATQPASAGASPRLIPAGVTVESGVARLRLQSTRDSFAQRVAKLDRPLVIEGSAATLLGCMGKWTPDFLADALSGIHNGTLEGVKQAESNVFRYFHHSLLNTNAIVNEYKASCFKKINMTARSFFARMGARADASGAGLSVQDPRFYSYASKLDDWGDLFRDLLPVDFLMVKPPEFDPESAHLFRQTYAWASPKGAVTPLHFDLFHNFYTQIHGKKHFLLMAPEAWEQVYLFPILHPGGRSSQIDFTADNPQGPLDPAESYNPFAASETEAEGAAAASAAPEDWATRVRFPNYQSVTAYEVVLSPGDVLYIPPLWFHQVTALEHSISVSVWSPFEGTEVASETVEKVPLPILSVWPTELRVAGLRLYLESLIENLKLGVNVAAFVHWSLLESRYKQFGVVDTALEFDFEVDRPRFCYSDPVQEQVLKFPGAKENLQSSLRQAVRLFQRLREVAGEARRDVFLADFFELSVAEIVGAQHVKQFLYDLCYC